MTGLPRLARRAAALLRDRAAESVREALHAGRTAASTAWARRPSGARASAIAFAVAIVVAGAWSTLAQARLVAHLPSPLDWAAARALVGRDARPGDVAVVSPAWAERARELLPSSVPVFAQRRYAGEDLVGVRRVWLVSLPDVPWRGWAPELDLAERAARAEPPAQLGGLEVTRIDLGFPTVPLAFLPDRLGQAEVTLGGAPCTPDGPARFRCGDGVAELSRAVREVAGVPRPCLSASTRAPLDAPIAVAFPAMRIGRTLRGHAGWAQGAGAAAPVRVAVLLDGEEVGAAEVTATGWAAFQVDLTRSAGQTRSLSLVVTSPGRLALCLDALVLP